MKRKSEKKMGENGSEGQKKLEKDYSLRSLWRAVMGLPTAAVIGVTSLASSSVKIPDDWETALLDYSSPLGKQSAEVYIVPAREPRGVVGFLPGWKTQAADKIEALRDIQESGYSVVSVSLVNPGLELGSLDDSLSRIKSFAFSDASPLYNMFPDKLPRFLVTHSTSGMLFQHALQDARGMGERLPPISHVFHTAPFFDTSGSSSLFHPTKNKLYTRHAMRHLHDLAGTPFMDRLYYYFRGISNLLLEEDPLGRPTHGQILEISGYGKKYFERRAEEDRAGGPRVTLPQTFIISTDDSFSCPKTAHKAAMLERAEIRFCQAQHNPLLAPPVRRSIIERLKDLTVPHELICYMDERLESLTSAYEEELEAIMQPPKQDDDALAHQMT